MTALADFGIFFCGLWLGVVVGFLLAAICRAAADRDRS